MSCCFIFSFNVFSILSFYVISIFLAQQHNLKCSLIDTQNEGIDVMRTNSYLHHASSVYDILLFYADKHISMSFKINLRLKLLVFYVHRASEVSQVKSGGEEFNRLASSAGCISSQISE